MNDLLITKLYAPPIRSNLVLRSRLVEKLNDGLQPGIKLILVSAPAGYGKTTLITQWLATIISDFPDMISGVKMRTAWVSLEEAENDPVRFMAYFITALESVYGSIFETSWALLQSPQPLLPEVVLTAILNEIAAVSENLFLVLDDYHVIHNPALHNQLIFLLEHQPAHMHLVVITREDPQLPISRLRARGQIVEIRQNDLRFSQDECTKFLVNVMGIGLTRDDVAALERRTEGWIVGLQLAALSMRGVSDWTGFIQTFTGSSRFVLDYLVEEVFSYQLPHVKDFLLKTSVLDRLSGPLCDVVAGTSGCQELLENLEKANLFIIPLDPSRRWYRYHHLFAGLLQHRLRTSTIDEKNLHQQASLWYEQNHFYPDAIRHAISSTDWGRVANLIQSIRTDYLKRGEVLTLLGWFQSLPEQMLLSDPRLCFDYCWSLLLVGQYDEAGLLLEQVERAAWEYPEFLGEVYAAQAYLARGKGDLSLMVEKSRCALNKLPINSYDTRGIVAMNLGLAYWHMGQMQMAEEVLLDALEVGQATSNHYVVLTTLIFLGRVYAVRGQLHQAKRQFERAVQTGSDMPGGEMPVNALAHMDLSALYYEWNELVESEGYLLQAIYLSKLGQNDEFLVGCKIFQTRLLLAQGKTSAAVEALEEAKILLRKGKTSGEMAARVDAAQIHLLLAKGEPPGEWEQKLTEKVDCHPFYRFLGVTKALTLPEKNARIYLQSLSQEALANQWVYGWIAVRALQASMAEKQEEAMDFLIEALKKAVLGGFIRSFVEAGEKMIPLLRQAAQMGITPDYAGRILAVITQEVDKKRAGSSQILSKGLTLVEPLSEREIEVLRLITAGMSNREIAVQLYISPGTAKTHVHNLCSKLGVRNRTEAAMKAKEFNLI